MIAPIGVSPVASPERRRIRKVVLPGQTPEGQHILSVLVKRTYDIHRGTACTRAEQDSKLYTADVFYVDPMNSAVQFESDFVPFKLATDVVFNGKFYAPKGQPVTETTVEISIGENRKRVLVTGDRTCHFRTGAAPAFSDPIPFVAMELRYERAYGGIDIYSNPRIPLPYMRNPLGRGFVVMNVEKAIEGLPLPNIEDPESRLTPERLCCGAFDGWEQQPYAAGFGWFPKTWLPRAQLAGVMPADRAAEQELRQAYTKLVPPDHRDLYAKTHLPAMDFRFFNGASAGLTVPYLHGGELIRTLNVTPEGEFSFYLPEDPVCIGVDLGAGIVEPPAVMHTVMIRGDDRQVDLVWRGAVPYPGPDWFPTMPKMDVLVDGGS